MLKKSFNLIFAAAILSSCATTKMERSHYFPGTEELSRADYKVTGDRTSEGSVTTSFGFINSAQTSKDYKKGVIGNIRREGGSILLGNLKINLTGFVTGAALSVSSAFLITKMAGTNNNLKSNNYGKPRVPMYFSIIPGAIIGYGLNNMFSATPTKKAQDLANYNFLETHKSDYILNPRYEIHEKSTFFKKTATIKLTSKGINIIPDIE